MVQDGTSGGGAVFQEAVTKRTDENFVDGGDENLPKSLVGATVLVEDGGGNIMGVRKVGELKAQRDVWDVWLGAGVERSDERRGRECCVHGGGESDWKKSKCSAAQVQLDRCGVRVQL